MLEIMKCHLCGKLAMIIRDGGRRTICCDQLMEKLNEQGKEQINGLHLPVLEKTATGTRVTIPSVGSPMEDSHFIEWIELSKGKYLQVKGLSPGEPPMAEFSLAGPGVKARAYCEEHGLWSSKPAKR